MISPRLSAALVDGSDVAIDMFLRDGPSAVDAFGGFLRESSAPRTTIRLTRDMADNSARVASRLAAAFPGRFLAVFNDREWSTDGDILMALGDTGRAEARPLLVATLADGASDTIRLAAAIGLGGLPGRQSADALLHALDHDPEYLVQYHAAKSLGSVGEVEDLPRLEALEHSDNFGLVSAARDAIAEIRERFHHGGPT